MLRGWRIGKGLKAGREGENVYREILVRRKDGRDREKVVNGWKNCSVEKIS